MPIPVLPSNSHHLTLTDIKTHAVTSLDIHHAPTRFIALENTLNGTILPLSACRSIAHWARAQQPPIWLHLDGARLWEAVAAGAGSLKDYSACFDSVTMCFSKGLGAPVGSVIVGEGAFVRKARQLRKMMGGGMRQAGVVTAAAQVAVRETFLGGRLAATHVRAQAVKGMWEARGGRVLGEVESNMVWLDLEAAGVGREVFVEEGVRQGVRLMGGRVVVHYQICAEAVERLGRVMDGVLGCRDGVDGNGVDGVDVKEEAEKVMEPQME